MRLFLKWNITMTIVLIFLSQEKTVSNISCLKSWKVQDCPCWIKMSEIVFWCGMFLWFYTLRRLWLYIITSSLKFYSYLDANFLPSCSFMGFLINGIPVSSIETYILSIETSLPHFYLFDFRVFLHQSIRSIRSLYSLLFCTVLYIFLLFYSLTHTLIKKLKNVINYDSIKIW